MVTTARLRIVYFGTPAFAVPALRALIGSPHPVVGLVSQPDRPKGRGQKLQPTATKVLADAAGIPVLQPTRLRDEAFQQQLAALAPDLGVVAAYGRLIPDAVLAIPRFGMINIHGSLLPRYRGAAPVHRAVINGEPETGVTIMRVVTELDAGPMFATAPRWIAPDETTPRVEAALADIGADLVLQVVEQIASGDAIEIPQDHEAATYARKIEREEANVDWTLGVDRIHNLVRGLQPWPLVAITLDGIRCRVHSSAVTDEHTSGPAGTVVTASDDVLGIACGDHLVLRILELQPDGKRVMSARDFLAGRRLSLGMPVSPPPDLPGTRE